MKRANPYWLAAFALGAACYAAILGGCTQPLPEACIDDCIDIPVSWPGAGLGRASQVFGPYGLRFFFDPDAEIRVQRGYLKGPTAGLAEMHGCAGRITLEKGKGLILAHELGHIMGLDHVWDRDDVMFKGSYRGPEVRDADIAVAWAEECYP